MASFLGCLLAVLLGLGQDVVPSWFTADPAVLALVASTIPFVIATQPINALAFVWDGVLFGAGGFRWAQAGCRTADSPIIDTAG
jgi:Na+-driven multidrug efflux pump